MESVLQDGNFTCELLTLSSAQEMRGNSLYGKINVLHGKGSLLNFSEVNDSTYRVSCSLALQYSSVQSIYVSKDEASRPLLKGIRFVGCHISVVGRQ